MVWKLADAAIVNRAFCGVIPIPTLPLFPTRKAEAPELDATLNISLAPDVPIIFSLATGEVVPMPTLPPDETNKELAAALACTVKPVLAPTRNPLEMSREPAKDEEPIPETTSPLLVSPAHSVFPVLSKKAKLPAAGDIKII